MFRILFAILSAAALITPAAQAAQLENIQGTVLVNSGSGFKAVTGRVELSPGDRVEAVNGSAEIVYDRCRSVMVGKGQVLLVMANNETKGTCTGGYKDGVAPAEALPDGLLLIGGLAAGGTGLGIALLDPKPASP
jgi:hypothetical protein